MANGRITIHVRVLRHKLQPNRCIFKTLAGLDRGSGSPVTQIKRLYENANLMQQGQLQGWMKKVVLDNELLNKRNHHAKR